MVRTKADRVPTKVVGGKAPKKPTVTSKKGGLTTKGGGNPYHPRDTPEWQKPITRFLGEYTAKKETVSSEAQVSGEQNAKKERKDESD